jgi:hypothetical protein
MPGADDETSSHRSSLCSGTPVLIVALEHRFHHAVGVATGAFAVIVGLVSLTLFTAVAFVVFDLAAANLMFAGLYRNGSHRRYLSGYVFVTF